MVFCAYCGKSFTRKEHLERHIPSHTNVKPHRCSSCQLSFARRDLLQRHHSTYHEANDSMQTVPNGHVAPVGGRTPIACLSCANAKTGCDKRVPCSRCAEKNLPCAARYARRSSKLANRSPSTTTPPAASTTAYSQPLQFSNVTYMDVDEKHGSDQNAVELKSPNSIPVDPALLPRGRPSPIKSQSFSPGDTMLGPSMLDLSPNHVMDDFMQLGNGELSDSISNYQDLLSWPDFPLDMEMYVNSTPGAHSSIAAMTYSEPSEVTSGSDIMTSTSSSGTSMSSPHSRSTSLQSHADQEQPTKRARTQEPSSTMMPEFEVVIAAESAWPFARCNPPTFSSTCPRTAIIHLESLEQNSKHGDMWRSLSPDIEDAKQNDAVVQIEPLASSTRDKILAITQTFLHKALETHRTGLNGAASNSMNSFNFLVLPPSNVLEYFLRSYVRSLSSYYTLIAGGTVDPNELMRNNQASTLLVLLMIAQGATAIPTVGARYLTAGLTETCRISLFDIIEKDPELSADPTVLRCALLFTILAAWSGDKWHMDMAMGQRGMYLAMLKHAGMLEPQRSLRAAFQGCTTPELQWHAWLNFENKNRLVYNWIMVDQELGLFHDTAPILSITEIEAPMPSAERLWLAKDAVEWLNIYQEIHGCIDSTSSTSPASSHPQSLCDLFQDLLHDNLQGRQTQLTPLELKLLLHPLQSLLCHLRQVLSCFSDVLSSRRRSRTVTKASTLLRLEEVQSLLQKWYDLCMIHARATPNCAVTQANLVMYHLISLNAVTSFPEIERLARKDGFDGSYWDLTVRHKRCIYQSEEAIYHCGQIFRLIRVMPQEGRPHWWSAAIYRATLILWVDSMSRMDASQPKQHNGPNIAVDSIMPENAAVARFLWNGDGTPVLTKRDGSVTSLNKPNEVLCHCIDIFDEGIAVRISDGLKRKLQTLFTNWNSEPMHQPAQLQ